MPPTAENTILKTLLVWVPSNKRAMEENICWNKIFQTSEKSWRQVLTCRVNFSHTEFLNFEPVTILSETVMRSDSEDLGF